MDISSLTPTQQEAMATFQAITEEYEGEICANFLSRNDWDVIAASNIYLAQGRDYYRSSPAMAGVDHREPEGIPVVSELEVPMNEERVEDPPPAQGVYWYLQYPWKIVQGAFSLVRGIFNVLTSPLRGQTGTVLNFLSILRDTGLQVPRFLEGSFHDALLQSRRERKPLIAIITDSSVPQDFYRDIVCSEISFAFFAEMYLAWGVFIRPGMVEEAAERMFSGRMPCVGVFRMEAEPVFLDKLEGNFPIEQFAEFLDRNFTHFQLMNSAGARNPVNPHLEQERAIREQQERELREAERMMEEKYRQEEEQKRQEIEAQRERERLEEQKKRELVEKAQKIGEEPPTGDGVTQLKIRLPSGQVIDRRFHQHTQVVLLYDFVDTLQIDVPFEIVTGYPAKVLEDLEKTLEQEELVPRALLHVREKID